MLSIAAIHGDMSVDCCSACFAAAQRGMQGVVCGALREQKCFVPQKDQCVQCARPWTPQRIQKLSSGVFDKATPDTTKGYHTQECTLPNCTRGKTCLYVHDFRVNRSNYRVVLPLVKADLLSDRSEKPNVAPFSVNLPCWTDAEWAVLYNSLDVSVDESVAACMSCCAISRYCNDDVIPIHTLYRCFAPNEYGKCNQCGRLWVAARVQMLRSGIWDDVCSPSVILTRGAQYRTVQCTQAGGSNCMFGSACSFFHNPLQDRNKYRVMHPALAAAPVPANEKSSSNDTTTPGASYCVKTNDLPTPPDPWDGPFLYSVVVARSPESAASATASPPLQDQQEQEQQQPQSEVVHGRVFCLQCNDTFTDTDEAQAYHDFDDRADHNLVDICKSGCSGRECLCDITNCAMRLCLDCLPAGMLLCERHCRARHLKNPHTRIITIPQQHIT